MVKDTLLCNEQCQKTCYFVAIKAQGHVTLLRTIPQNLLLSRNVQRLT